MAVSKAKKQRIKVEREGRRNPEAKRYQNVGLTTRVKQDKTKYSRKGRSPAAYTQQNEPVLFSFLLAS